MGNSFNNYVQTIEAVESLVNEIEGVSQESLVHNENINNILLLNKNVADAVDRLKNGDELAIKCEMYINALQNRDKHRSMFLEMVNKQEKLQSKRITRIKMTLSLVAAIFVTLFILLNNSSIINGDNEIIIANNFSKNIDVVVPTLLVGDIKRVNLIDNSEEIYTKLENSKKINPSNDIQDNTHIEDTIVNNVLIVPNKFAHKIELPDGTTVQLSANSRLIFPEKFVGDARKVTLEGMAIFDVVKGAKQFIVNTRGVDIKVYGTKFCVNSYNNTKIRTTLISGSLGVNYNTLEEEREIMIKPYEEVSVNIISGESKKIENVDVTKYLAWEEGYFRCDNESLITLISDLSNWYGVSFKYNLKDIEDINVDASLSRDTTIDEVLEMVSYIAGVEVEYLDGIYYLVKP